MLSFTVLYFILLWVVPGYLMVLIKYDTPRFNGYSKYIPLLLFVFMPFAGNLYYANPVRRLLIFYGYMVSILTYTLTKFYGKNLVWAFSVSGITCLVSSYLWELPWLLRNAFVTGPEPDWVLHFMGLFFVWYVASNIGFKKDRDSKIVIVLFLIVSTLFMIYTGYGVGYASDKSAFIENAYVWNSNGFMFIRALSILTVLQSLDISIHQMNTKEVEEIDN